LDSWQLADALLFADDWLACLHLAFFFDTRFGISNYEIADLEGQGSNHDSFLGNIPELTVMLTETQPVPMTERWLSVKLTSPANPPSNLTTRKVRTPRTGPL